MDTTQARTAAVYEYGLLIKHILQAPIAYSPEQEIVYRGDVRLTYGRFHERVARLASALTGLGVRPGDTVGVMDWDSNRYLECYFAIPLIGAVLHTINVRLSPEQLVYTIDHADDSVILVHADFVPMLEAVRGRLDKVRDFVLLRDGDSAATGAGLTFSGEYEALLDQAPPMAEFPDLDEHTRATTFYTTGTTGLPKAVSFSHRQIVLHTVANTASLASISGGPRFHAGDVYMPLTPMFHVHAWGIPYIATFLGIKQVYAGRYIPAVINRLITTEKVTFSHCVPTILAMLVRDPGNAEVDYSNWKVIIGGAALPRSLAAAALDRGINVFAGYGMSETGPVVSFVRLDREALALGREEQLALRVRTGTPVGLTYVKVVDNNGQEAPWDDRTPGEIVLRCPWLTHGYDKDSINSERLWEGGWLHTQDVAVRSPEGSLRITDRLKDVVKVGGEWVSSLEMEDMIALHPEVDDCAVISCADERWGEIPLAVVVPRQAGRLGERDVVRHVRTYVDSGVLPREALLVKVILCDGLDKTSVGKTDKVALRTRYAHSP